MSSSCLEGRSLSNLGLNVDDSGRAEKLLSERILLVYPREPAKLTLKMVWKTTVSSLGTAYIGTLPNAMSWPWTAKQLDLQTEGHLRISEW